MTVSAEFLAQEVIRESRRQMAEGLGKIKHCVRQLSDEQVWWRARDSANSIANVLLHLDGNLNQWLVNGIRQKPDVRDRPTEFAVRGGTSKDALLDRLEATVARVDAALASQSAATLLENRRIQGFDITVLGAIFDSMPHFRGHVQEIIYVTRHLLGDAYQFAWTPSSPEQGAPK